MPKHLNFITHIPIIISFFSSDGGVAESSLGTFIKYATTRTTTTIFLLVAFVSLAHISVPLLVLITFCFISALS